MKTLICIAPDGEFVCENKFKTINEAWERSNDMGSRWYFYPVHVVTSGNKMKSRISAVPDGMPNEWIGKTIKSLVDAFKANSQAIVQYLEHGFFPFYP
jgi:hypothetical protein